MRPDPEWRYRVEPKEEWLSLTLDELSTYAGDFDLGVFYLASRLLRSAEASNVDCPIISERDGKCFLRWENSEGIVALVCVLSDTQAKWSVRLKPTQKHDFNVFNRNYEEVMRCVLSALYEHSNNWEARDLMKIVSVVGEWGTQVPKGD